MIFYTQGIIIKRTDFNEFDKLLTVYTKEFGKIFVKAKGVKKLESKLKSQIELFTLTFFCLAKGKSFDVLTGAEVAENFNNIHSNLKNLAACFWMSELLDKLIPAPQKDLAVWDLILRFLKWLDKGKIDSSGLKFFEDCLLKILGHPPRQKTTLSQWLFNERINSIWFLSSFVKTSEDKQK